MTERAYTNDEIAELEGLRASIKAIDDAPVERYRAALAVLRGDPAQRENGTAAVPTLRPETPKWERKWPHDQPHGWNLDAAGFLQLIQSANGMMWLTLGRAKYVELRVDTRDGGFNLYDRDGAPLNPDEVVAAVEEVKAKYSAETASPYRSTPQAGTARSDFSLRWAIDTVLETFRASEAAGYRSKDRQYAIDILGKAIDVNPAPPSQAGTAQSELVAPDNLSEQLRHIAAWAESGISIRDHIDKLYMAANEIARLKAVAVPASQAGMREALEPFAKAADLIECTTSHEYFDTDEWEVSIGDLRRARAALQSSQPEAGDEDSYERGFKAGYEVAASSGSSGQTNEVKND